MPTPRFYLDLSAVASSLTSKGAQRYKCNFRRNRISHESIQGSQGDDIDYGYAK